MAVPRFNYELPPARRNGRFACSVAAHALAITVLVNLAQWLPAAHIESRRDSQVTLLYTPPPPVPTTPVPKITPPPPKLLAKLSPPKIVAPPPEAPRVEPPRIEPKPLELSRIPAPVPPEPKKPVVTGTFASNEIARPVAVKKDVMTDNFASGSSAPVTLQQKTAREVQTGGFGDPNGVKGNSEKKGLITVASLGSFDLPAGQGYGNGTAGARGARGTIASAGFGDGTAGAGQGDHRRTGTVAQAGFSEVAVSAPAAKAHVEEKPNLTPVEILYKPKPLYTQEARQIRLQGEVLVRVTFGASGELHVQEVVRGLGHGLDEAALRAAQQIRFRPALRNGAPYDSTALVHIVFELAE